ncbi:hypothetical protein CBS63078_3240 [Aspergillus niger]|nr:hypothetical protein CBS133816_6788 [Aspergillus niger]KAI2849103.1 hypothetical protein CBS11350_2255 [Aspergillus niger]KAI2904795.1 hypothetical protein CBS13152_827 [Aspergillus niger]KAI2917421.1 hypothetical protein CBS63078_3240 [Aspergillus niger]KAI2925008.1 hypothetical protein CBS147371_566 [Aspergillus niger]
MGSACQANDQSISGEENPVGTRPRELYSVSAILSGSHDSRCAVHVDFFYFNPGGFLAFFSSAAAPPVHRLTTTTSVSSPALRLLSFARFPIRPEGTSFSLQPLPHEDFHSCTDFLQEARDWLAVNLIRSTF